MNHTRKHNLSLLEVIPIGRGIGKETLTYFTSEDIPLGSLIDVPVRKKKMKAIVVGAMNAGEMKSVIRSANFSIKNIGKTTTKTFIDPEFMRAAVRAAEYFVGSTGAVLNSLLPKGVLEQSELFFRRPLRRTLPKSTKQKEVKENSGGKFHSHALQLDFDARIHAYARLIETEAEKNNSLFILVPTKQDGRLVEAALKKMTSVEIFSFNTSLSKKILIERWSSAVASKKSIVMIGTGSFLCLPRTDISTIIIEHESSRAFKSQSRPFVDFRVVAKLLAKEKSLSLLYADSLLSVETYASEKGRIEFPQMKPAEVIDMRTSKQPQQDLDSKIGFRILNRKVLGQIEQALDQNEKIFLFASRRGYASNVVCKDCGQTVLCINCSAPVTLHLSKQAELNFFLCHHCGEKRSALERCKNCDGWNLLSFGVGTEKIEEEIKKHFPETAVIVVDKTATTTEKQIVEKIGKFYVQQKGAILIGTEMALPYLQESLAQVIVTSMDSLFALPDFRINERILHILLRLDHVSVAPLIIQTRNPEHGSLLPILKNDIGEFYEREIADRARFGYPPFKLLVKIKIEGKNKEEVRVQAEKMKLYFKDKQPFLFPAFISTQKKKYVMHLLLKIDPNDWPEQDIVAKLRTLGPTFIVQVDPDSIL